GRVGPKDLRILSTAQRDPGETRRQAERPDYRGGAVPPLSRLSEAVGSDRHRERQLQLGGRPAPLPDGAEVHSQTLGGSIGWATEATLGIALADPSRRTVLFTGEGSHQMTAADVGTMARHGLKPVIFVLNNAGYMVERALEVDPDWVYNDL